jgi:hypothetical protein
MFRQRIGRVCTRLTSAAVYAHGLSLMLYLSFDDLTAGQADDATSCGNNVGVGRRWR